jgi:hypothetical protein
MWINCQWVRVTATRKFWASLPHVRRASLVGCASVMGVLPPLPTHVPTVPPAAPGQGDYNPPAVFIPGPEKVAAKEWSGGDGPLQPAFYVTPGWRSVPIDYRDDSEYCPPPAKVPEPAPVWVVGLGLLVLWRVQKRTGTQ